MNGSPAPVVFFDIGGTLAAPKVSPVSHRLERLTVFPAVLPILQGLRDAGARLGVISNTGDETAERMRELVEQCGLYPYFEPGLLVYSSVEGIGKDSPELFRRAAARAGHGTTPDRCVFVGDDSRERSLAVEVGLRAAPHPQLAREVLDGARLRYARVTVPDGGSDERWRAVLADLPLAPLHVTGVIPIMVYAIISERVAARLDDLGFVVDRLGRAGDPVTTDLYLLHDDRRTRTGFLSPEGQSAEYFAGGDRADWVLCSTGEGLFVALPADRSIGELHFTEVRHGHGVKLIPDLTRLTLPGANLDIPLTGLRRQGTAEFGFGETLPEAFEDVTADLIEGYLQRYSGESPIDETGIRITSRHVDHEHNGLAVDALAREFQELGGDRLSVSLHEFTYGGGRKLHNVVAELAGQGSDELVLVTAHMDSTGLNPQDRDYEPQADPAPGKDDDMSGTAGVLVIARSMVGRARARSPKRSVHFVLFNAEEQSLVGSQEYAGAQAKDGAKIVAVFQMDMIGYNVNPPRSWELHVGVRRPNDEKGPPGPLEARAEAKSKDVAKLVRQVSGSVSPRLEAPQVFTSPDDAARRSDHYSFQERGYAACLAIEDYFPFGSPEAEGNPNYHSAADTFVDLEYAADIARVVGAAAWMVANA